MARIKPLSENDITPPIKQAFENHIKNYQARITNMKSTLGHSLLAFDVYMQWYALYADVEKILGKRLSYLYAYAISYASDCPLCSTFFRKIIIDAGEKPENLELSPFDEQVLEFGSTIASHNGNIPDNVYNPLAAQFNETEMVILIAFAGQMIATNIFNNVIETDIDEYLSNYLAPGKISTDDK